MPLGWPRRGLPELCGSAGPPAPCRPGRAGFTHPHGARAVWFVRKRRASQADSSFLPSAEGHSPAGRCVARDSGGRVVTLGGDAGGATPSDDSGRTGLQRGRLSPRRRGGGGGRGAGSPVPPRASGRRSRGCLPLAQVQPRPPPPGRAHGLRPRYGGRWDTGSLRSPSPASPGVRAVVHLRFRHGGHLPGSRAPGTGQGLTAVLGARPQRRSAPRSPGGGSAGTPPADPQGPPRLTGGLRLAGRLPGLCPLQAPPWEGPQPACPLG